MRLSTDGRTKQFVVDGGDKFEERPKAPLHTIANLPLPIGG